LNFEDYLKVDPRFYRASEKTTLCGDATKAKRKLGWSASRDLDSIIEEMVQKELESSSDQIG
ncbi:MAG: GDP-mannose 4,6-dehydratase, partial [Verrucomicrobiota bacterium]|nr:GDP-mannose 4,6-dehydratase [Verrucomicrobiota bacterium]